MIEAELESFLIHLQSQADCPWGHSPAFIFAHSLELLLMIGYFDVECVTFHRLQASTPLAINGRAH